jgi:hypothetical protein
MMSSDTRTDTAFPYAAARRRSLGLASVVCVKIMLVGDAHGNTQFMRAAMRQARESGCGLTIQLGDFGFWPGEDGRHHLKYVCAASLESDMPLWVIDGNHDDPNIYGAMTTLWPTMRPGTIQRIQRGTVLKLHDRTIGFLGSAVSIDQGHRTPGRSWWPEEVLSAFDVDTARANSLSPPLDVMLSHDSTELPPVLKPWPFASYIMDALALQVERFAEVFDAWKPALHVHGHYHVRYSHVTPYGRRLGLDAEHRRRGLAILDTDDLSCY